jgi:hypothetical protein
VNERATIEGIAAIIIFIVIAFYLVFQFRSYLKSKKAKETVDAIRHIITPNRWSHKKMEGY